MSTDWPSVALRDLCSIARGGSPRPIKNFITDDPDGINWIKIGDTQKGGRYIDSTAEKIKPEGIARSRFVEEGSFLLSNSMSFGRPYILRTSGCIHDGWLVLEPDYARVDQNFLYYVLGSRTVFDQFDRLAAGSTVRNLNIDLVKGVEIPLPPLEEQQRIVAVLDEVFEGLARARAHAEANLQNARELFESAVNSTVLGDRHRMPHDVQDDGVRDLKDEQRKRTNDRKFRGPRFIASKGEPKLPDGWIWASPEQLCTHIVDCLHATPKWATSGEVCLRTTNFRVGELDLTETRYVSPETYAQRISRLEPKPGDVLYSREGGILGIACIHPEGLKACLGQRMMQFRLRQNLMLPEFFCAVLNSALVLGEVRHFTGGAAAPHLNIGDIRQFPIPVPPLQEQAEMVEIIEAQTDGRRRLQSAYETKIQYLDDLRQSLLQKAFAGELT
ncbi:type I restriction endonuclease subunit S [Marivita lacus]|uniref:Type I restriction endonuclease subunit S n=1 Tax=Marivita lacus TaxID=1323742 RepID=A0ABQ1L3P9_9RHOB|nr:restriction endonuclease subunit S [Marivita lacus]GGC16657.1 type I restriction endonuclease subunit S [Marivita lacus]